MPKTIAVIGGGAAGFFSAITCAEADADIRVIVFERSRHILSKVKISGGGRCNVTHSCFDPKELIKKYPRGSRELLGPFYTWQPSNTIDWYESNGVPLKTEADGRMFPTTDSSASIIECLTSKAESLNIEVRRSTEIVAIEKNESGPFSLKVKGQEPIIADRVIIASGGGAKSGGLRFAADFGHTITELAPSLFTFHIDDPRIADLQGLSVKNATVSCKAARLEQSGPMLITHWGLSGPAVLKLSAWGARKLANLQYQFTLCINWTGTMTQTNASDFLIQKKQEFSRKSVRANCPFDLPKRIWERFLDTVQVPNDCQWAQLPNKQIALLSEELTQGRYQVTDKSMNKEEFVTCGGVKLSEIDFKRMESKRVPGLHFAGEVLDIDGVTGGFNFQAAWTTGYIAGNAAAE